VAATRVILVSDTHLSASAPEAQANWDAVLGYIAVTAPDLVIHLGDLSMDGARNAADLDYGRAQLDRLPVPWRAVPGNHDIGDNPWPGAASGNTVDAVRHQRWLDTVGADYWQAEVGGWTVLAVNAQLLGSGLPAEAEQWSWLAEQITANRHQPVALLTHKPVTAAETELADAPPFRFWPPEARAELARLFGDAPPALVISGHVHQYRRQRLDATDYLWAPTTWALLPDQIQPVFGAKRCGVVSLDLSAGELVDERLVEPPGLRQLTTTIDLPDPYHAPRP
jgi:3',5'-cyclic-AMP phosphodiesterase